MAEILADNLHNLLDFLGPIKGYTVIREELVNRPECRDAVFIAGIHWMDDAAVIDVAENINVVAGGQKVKLGLERVALFLQNSRHPFCVNLGQVSLIRL